MTFEEFKNKLLEISKANKVIDISSLIDIGEENNYMEDISDNPFTTEYRLVDGSILKTYGGEFAGLI